MNKVILATIVSAMLVGTAHADMVMGSNYDTFWTITVTDCFGNVTTYSNCVITQVNTMFLTFIPDQGRIQTNNGKRKKVPLRSTCMNVDMMEE